MATSSPRYSHTPPETDRIQRDGSSLAAIYSKVRTHVPHPSHPPAPERAHSLWPVPVTGPSGSWPIPVKSRLVHSLCLSIDVPLIPPATHHHVRIRSGNNRPGSSWIRTQPGVAYRATHTNLRAYLRYDRHSSVSHTSCWSRRDTANRKLSQRLRSPCGPESDDRSSRPRDPISLSEPR